MAYLSLFILICNIYIILYQNKHILFPAEELVREFDSPHLRLQLDIFHLQFMKGDITNNIKRLLSIVGK